MALSANERLVLDEVTKAGKIVLGGQVAANLLDTGKFKGSRGLKKVATRAGVTYSDDF